MQTTLPTVQLGRTDMRLTRVGFGAWAIGGGGWFFAWGEQDDDESVAAIRHAAENGLNWVDTAAVYGLGHSEEVVAKALRGLPEADRPYVFTKAGVVWDETDRAARPPRQGSPASIRRDAATSLLPWCASHGTGVIVYSPMGSGLLTGAFTAERAERLEPDDWRRGHPDFSGDGLERNLALADALRLVAEKRQTTVAAVAVAWTLAFDGVTGANPLIIDDRRHHGVQDRQ